MLTKEIAKGPPPSANGNGPLSPEELVKIKSIQKNKGKSSSKKKPSKIKKPRLSKKSLPTWWLRLSDKQRELYIKKRPKSKFAPYVYLSKKKKHPKAANENKGKPVTITSRDARVDAQAALAAHPDDRRAVRDHLDRLSENPKALTDYVGERLTEDSIKDRIDPETLKTHEEDIKDSVKKKDVKKWSKLLKKTLVYAGLGLAGAFFLGTGTLPYAIIVANLIKESYWAFGEFNRAIDDGSNVLSAMCTAGSNLVARMSKNPAVLASTVAIAYGAKSNTDEDDDKTHDEYFDGMRKSKPSETN